MHLKYLIVGQGIAGTTLAHQFLKNHIEFKIIDHQATPSSSKVAAGIYNPVTGKRFVKTWLAETLYPLIEPFYKEIEAFCGQQFLQTMPINRPLDSVKEQNQIIELCEKAEIEQFASFEANHTQPSFLSHKYYGNLQSKQSGWLNLPFLLSSFRKKLKEKNLLINDSFSFKKLSISNEILTYNKEEFTGIVFCEGYYIKDNPFFNYLPFKPVKGDILEVEMENGPKNQIVSKGIFIVPLGAQKYKVGATYNWDDMTWQASKEGIEELTKKLAKITNESFKVTATYGGIRPSTIDRRPYLGAHPKHANIYIFNGFGAKAVSLCPYFSAEMLNFIIKKEHINLEANISRFSSLYLGSNK